ncbi:MAG: excisionase [Firmicutes bacterium HGW-Firmicutes-4]|jgi:excisionase family DNA binding protein|nr:MAG: excisionase [Firmicutes bacterium HGW-Firmicutes-4]
MEKLTINVKELSKQLGVSIPTAYELTRRSDFPTLKIGRRIVIPVEAFQLWLISSSQQNKEE